MITLVLLVVVFIGVLVKFGEGLASRNGAVVFFSFAILWLLGTTIKIYLGKVKVYLHSLKNEDMSMDEEV